MTDQELDRMMRRVLTDALKAEEDLGPEETVPFQASPRHRHSMRKMRKDPVRWLRERKKPVWRRVLNQAAMLLLALGVGFGALTAMVPSVRAAVVRWFVEWYETSIVFRYAGEDDPGQLPEYEITALPDGFVETERFAYSSLASVTYEDKSGKMISLEYNFMEEGVATTFYLDGSAATTVTVDGMKGLFFEAEVPGGFNTVTWIDEGRNIHFSVSGDYELSVLLQMAESVLKKIEKK